MNWCEHIKIEEKKHTRYKCGGKEGLSESVFNFCPECGAKRPERKGLAEKFLEECERLNEHDTYVLQVTDVRKLLAICKLQREELKHIKSCSRCHFYPGECNELIDIEMKSNAIASEKGEL